MPKQITIEDARKKWREYTSGYVKNPPVRTAVLGDGRGQAASNMYVPNGNNEVVWAREYVGDNKFFAVINRAKVVPSFNLPVKISYTFDELGQEQVIGVNYAGMGGSLNITTVNTLGPHHQQHEFGGGDEVYIDGLLFKPGLVYPTSPASMQLKVSRFNYYWNTWNQFDTATTASLAQFVPGSSMAVYVLIALDPETGTLVYRPGVPINLALAPFTTTGFSFSYVPAPAGNEIPLAFIGLAAGTTSINWTDVQNQIGDARLHISAPTRYLLDRFEQLEGYTGNPPNLATTGAAASSVDDVNHSLGGLTDVALDGVTDSQALVYSQARNQWIPGTATGGGATIYTLTPAGVGASPVAGTSTSATAGDHVHKGVLTILAGTGTSVSTDTAGCVTVGMTGSGWASAIQTTNRASEVTYTNGSLTRMVNITLGLKPSVTVSADFSFLADAASPPTTEVTKLSAVSGLGASIVEELTALVMPNERYMLKNLTAAGPTTELIRWIEYDNYGGATLNLDNVEILAWTGIFLP